MVFQEPVLFDWSIAANIRYGASFKEVGDEEVVEAARAANIHDFITSLPEVGWGVCGGGGGGGGGGWRGCFVKIMTVLSFL